MIERLEAAWHANDFVSDRIPQEYIDLNDAIKLAEDSVDEEIVKILGQETALRIQDMLQATPYLQQVNQHYEPAMAQAGVPLAPEQVLPLAEILYHTYGSPNNPDIPRNRQLIDVESALSPLDRLALERSIEVLSPRQIGVLKEKIAAINRAYYLKKKS